MLVLPCGYEEFSLDDFKDEMLKVKLNGEVGFVNSSGCLVIPCLYKNASDFNNGLSEIRYYSKKKLGYINKSGVEYWED